MFCWKKWYHKVLDRFLSKYTSQIFVVSEKVKLFYKVNVGINENILKVVYNGIESSEKDISYVEGNKLKKELGLSLDKPVIANIGRLVPAKANHIFIDTSDILPWLCTDIKDG